MSDEWPTHIGELSAWSLNHAIETLEKTIGSHDNAGLPNDAQKALAVIRLVAKMPRACPWWGQVIDSNDSSVHVGVMMRNAFEALGEDIDESSSEGLIGRPKSWFTQLYLPRWTEGRRRYYDFLDHLLDPVHWEEEYERKRLSDEQAAAERARMAHVFRKRPR